MVVICFSCKEEKTTVHLKGQLKGMTPSEVMRYNGTASMIGDSRDIILHTDENGMFDTVIELKKPEYFPYVPAPYSCWCSLSSCFSRILTG